MSFGKISLEDLSAKSREDLIKIIIESQLQENFILATDSYKMTHHLLYPEGLTEVYSYLEPRGGEMSHTLFFGLQYYVKKYLAGLRITKENIEEAHQQNIKHFGFDCFNRELWDHIVNDCDGKLPLEIKAVKEGMRIPVKNALLSIRNTTSKSAALTNITETLLMKLWYPTTVAEYSNSILKVIRQFASETSDNDSSLTRFLIHDFGYRGVSSEETAGIGGAAHIAAGNMGSDTFSGIRLLQQYYGADMPAYSVIASEHSIMCSFGRDNELEAYRNAITKASSEAILSLVSDTYNIYNVCRNILPSLKEEILARTGKLVVRPDSGDAEIVLFGYKIIELPSTVVIPTDGTHAIKYHDGTYKRVNAPIHKEHGLEASLTEISRDEAIGIFNILFEEFGSSINSKGYKVLCANIGVLQGDGISLKTVKSLLQRAKDEKIDTTCLVTGSGGKLLQAHDRDEQKYAIKATNVVINGVSSSIMKDPITDPGKKSKRGYLKLAIIDGEYKTLEFETLEDYNKDTKVDLLETVFLDGDLVREQTLEEILTYSLV